MILAIVGDLIFASKIGQTAKLAGITVDFATAEQKVMDFAGQQPRLIIVDLNFNAINPLSLIGKLKQHPHLHHTTILGFLSHVQADLRLAAQNAGCDLVLPRSAFSQNLSDILKQYL
jgi:PleD family two-component response regulator